MFRDSAGNPRPKGLDQIEAALMELDYCLQGRGALIQIHQPQSKNGVIVGGWVANTTDAFGIEFETAPHNSRSELFDDLTAAGFERFEVI